MQITYFVKANRLDVKSRPDGEHHTAAEIEQFIDALQYFCQMVRQREWELDQERRKMISFVKAKAFYGRNIPSQAEQ